MLLEKFNGKVPNTKRTNDVTWCWQKSPDIVMRFVFGEPT